MRTEKETFINHKLQEIRQGRRTMHDLGHLRAARKRYSTESTKELTRDFELIW